MDYGFKIGVTLPLAQWSYTERIRNALDVPISVSYGRMKCCVSGC